MTKSTGWTRGLVVCATLALNVSYTVAQETPSLSASAIATQSPWVFKDGLRPPWALSTLPGDQFNPPYVRKINRPEIPYGTLNWEGVQANLRIAVEAAFHEAQALGIQVRFTEGWRSLEDHIATQNGSSPGAVVAGASHSNHRSYPARAVDISLLDWSRLGAWLTVLERHSLYVPMLAAGYTHHNPAKADLVHVEPIPASALYAAVYGGRGRNAVLLNPVQIASVLFTNPLLPLEMSLEDRNDAVARAALDLDHRHAEFTARSRPASGSARPSISNTGPRGNSVSSGGTKEDSENNGATGKVDIEYIHFTDGMQFEIGPATRSNDRQSSESPFPSAPIMPHS